MLVQLARSGDLSARRQAAWGMPVKVLHGYRSKEFYMAYEPFSQSTRKTRSTLLVFSVLATAIVQFDVELKNIPGIGFEIPIPEGMLSIVVGISILYLTISFLLYCMDDLFYMTSPDVLRERSELIEKRLADLKIKKQGLVNKIQALEGKYNSKVDR